MLNKEIIINNKREELIKECRRVSRNYTDILRNRYSTASENDEAWMEVIKVDEKIREFNKRYPKYRISSYDV